MASRTKQLAYTGMFTAIIAVMSQLAIPMPSGVPATLQTLAIAITGLMLGVRTGTISVGLYITIGAIGLPVFSAFRSGFGTLFGVTGGFIFGFIPFVILCALARNMKNKIVAVSVCVAGLMLCHLTGIIQFMIVSNTAFIPTALTVSLPYLLKDVISCILAYIISIQLKKVITVD
ncbi:MAG: biotin transporter BioY [Clostridia bacterium]|jgi:biotin transport system substrate-specific component|nr:biotin transporter BioY [Clostridia bacterium]NLV34346.1 biotin transporter BioY [Clostridiaceae bacterium]OQB52582.1 MAG: Biotin transporter BioY [Firmicutes bacterium ADurb.Bin146]HOD93972.1 biotin transporter BioY [Clostridia bacterium]HQM96715.1 biotin transporter BioY [Clostridia bacterium]